MGKMISLTEYAAKHNRSAVSARQKAARGGFQTAAKIGGTWIIDEDEPYEDLRSEPVPGRACASCGAEITGGSNRQYCANCLRLRRNQLERERWARKKNQNVNE